VLPIIQAILLFISCEQSHMPAASSPYTYRIAKTIQATGTLPVCFTRRASEVVHGISCYTYARSWHTRLVKLLVLLADDYQCTWIRKMLASRSNIWSYYSTMKAQKGEMKDICPFQRKRRLKILQKVSKEYKKSQSTYEIQQRICVFSRQSFDNHLVLPLVDGMTTLMQLKLLHNSCTYMRCIGFTRCFQWCDGLVMFHDCDVIGPSTITKGPWFI